MTSTVSHSAFITWNNREDSFETWETWSSAFLNSLPTATADASYCLDPIRLAAARPIPPVLEPVAATAAAYGALNPANKVWDDRKNASNRSKLEAEEKKIHQIEIDHAYCIMKLIGGFTDCEARRVMTRARVSGASNEANFNAMRAQLELVFKPSRIVDVSNLRRQLEYLTDCGKTSVQYVTDYFRISGALVSAGLAMVDEVREAFILEHFHNPGMATMKDGLRAGTNLGPNRPATSITWNTFLTQVRDKGQAEPDVNEWGLNKMEFQEVSAPGKFSVRELRADARGGGGRGGGGRGGGGRGAGARGSSGGRGGGRGDYKPYAQSSGGASKSSGGEPSTASTLNCYRCGSKGHPFYLCPNTACTICGKKIGVWSNSTRPAGGGPDHDTRNCYRRGSTADSSRDVSTMKNGTLKRMIQDAENVLSARAFERDNSGTPARSGKRKAKRAKFIEPPLGSDEED